MTLGNGNRFLLLYGSETGQAKAIAEEIADKCSDHGLEADLFCLSKTEKKFWLERESCAVFVVSTTGDGEPPETVTKFFRRLKKKTLSNTHLSHLCFTLLGLGDSNYTNFCNCGKMLNARLLQLGATHFYDPGWADDATGLEIVADPWMDALWPALQRHLGLSSDTTDAATSNYCETAANLVNHMQPSNVLLNHFANETKGIVSIDTCRIPTSDVNLRNETSDMLSVDQTIMSDVNLKNEPKMSDVTIDGSHSDVTIDGSHSDTNLKNIELCSTSNSNIVNHSSMNGKGEVDSLTYSLPPLSESPLGVPALPESYLNLMYSSEQSVDLEALPFQNGCPLPSASSPVVMATVTKATRLTSEGAVKKALKLELDISECGWDYEPGDSFSVICPNPAGEVDLLLHRLGVAEQADISYTLSVIQGTKKKNASIPPHLPTIATLRHTLTTCCDIRSVPKKAFLRTLAAHTSDQREQRRLLELCSRQGGSHFTQFLREPSICVLDLLTAFPSCTPPMTALLEHLPRLQPRPYSSASCSAVHPGQLHFVFNVVEIPGGQGRQGTRRGVCTGWLDDLTRSFQGQMATLEEAMGQLKVTGVKIPVFLRSNQHFRPPAKLCSPVLMIGPGTGVAPFIGFLQHRQHVMSTGESEPAAGPCWLLYGCRHQHRDYLFRDELKCLESSGVLTKLATSFSRDDQNMSAPRYVQDSIRLHSSDICDLIMNPETCVYICGDAKHMAKGVAQTLCEVLIKEKAMSLKEAESHLMQMRLHRRYLEDVWV